MPIQLQLKRKTILISSWSPPMIGGPQSMCNIFSLIAPGNFAMLTSGRILRSALATDKLGSWLPCTYYAAEGGKITKQKIKSHAVTEQKQPVNLASKLRTIPVIGKFLYNLGHFAIDIVYFVSTGVRLVRRDHFELILGFSDNGIALVSTWLVAKLTRRPYALFLYDLYLGNNFEPPFSWFARWFEPTIMRRAKVVLLTNEGTQEYYQKRYGPQVRMAVVHNAKVLRPQPQHYAPEPPYSIVYTGAVSWAQGQALLNMVRAMDLLQDLPITLHLYVPNPPPALIAAIAGKTNITMSAASQDSMSAIQIAATLLFLPLSWNTSAPDIISTATPGKFTDYLAAGRPMLVHAPKYAYVSKYARQHQLGIVVDRNDVNLLATTIRDFLKNPDAGQTYVQNALRIFHQNHDVQNNARKLTELLNML